MALQKSTSVLKTDVLTICGELTNGSSPYDAQATSYLDKVYQGIIAGNNLFGVDCMEPWVWAQSKHPILLTLNAVQSGACTLTKASMAGSFSVAPTLSYEGRYLAPQGQPEIYKIAQHTAGATSFSIDQPYLGPTGSISYSAFKYDYDAFNDVIIVTTKNNKLDFSEGGAQLTASIAVGSYSPADLCTEIVTRMNAAGSKTYTAIFDSITRKFTIVQGGTTFSLLFGSGSNAYVSSSGILGFDVMDQIGVVTYSSSYALSGIVRMSKPITSYKSSITYDQAARDSNKIYMIDDNTFQRDFPMNRLSLQIPDRFCVVEQNRDGLLALRFNASVLTDTRIEVNYIPVARKLVDNVNSYPRIPGSFSDVLVYGAAHFIQMDKSDSKAQDSLQKAQAELKALIAFNRQGSQLAGDKFGKLVARPEGNRRLWGTGSAY